MASRDAGSIKARDIVKMPLPLKGETKVYILTSAQNNTGVHPQLWANLLAYAKHRKATLMVGSFTYNKPSHRDGQKRKTARESSDDAEWWAPEVEPYLHDYSIALTNTLIWCGELQILPTAVDPISGLESYTGRASAIIPHTKFAMKSVASPKMRGTKLVYTTGTVTKRNYIQKKAGQKAEFHHGFGAVIVEVTSAGTWFVRQLSADKKGDFYDLSRKVAGGRITTGHRPEALVWGDIHVAQLGIGMRELAWGKGGILDQLRPRRQVFHDTLDFRARNHHDIRDPWKTFDKYVTGNSSVFAEVTQAAEFLRFASRRWVESIVVASNHDRALERWLKEGDFREDPGNARMFLRANLAAYDAIEMGDKDFYAVEWAFRWAASAFGGLPKNVRFLRQDREYVICHDANGGIELGMHGDKGAGGAKGSLLAFARMGRKCIVADSHTAGIRDGAYQVGVMGSLDQGYNEGLSSWSHTNALVYPNGKRTLFTIWEGEWHG